MTNEEETEEEILPGSFLNRPFPTTCYNVDVVKYSIAPNTNRLCILKHKLFSERKERKSIFFNIFHIISYVSFILLINIPVAKEIARLYPQLKLIPLSLSELLFCV